MGYKVLTLVFTFFQFIKGEGEEEHMPQVMQRDNKDKVSVLNNVIEVSNSICLGAMVFLTVCFWHLNYS